MPILQQLLAVVVASVVIIGATAGFGLAGGWATGKLVKQSGWASLQEVEAPLMMAQTFFGGLLMMVIASQTFGQWTYDGLLGWLT